MYHLGHLIRDARLRLEPEEETKAHTLIRDRELEYLVLYLAQCRS